MHEVTGFVHNVLSQSHTLSQCIQTLDVVLGNRVIPLPHKDEPHTDNLAWDRRRYAHEGNECTHFWLHTPITEYKLSILLLAIIIGQWNKLCEQTQNQSTVLVTAYAYTMGVYVHISHLCVAGGVGLHGVVGKPPRNTAA